MTLANDGLRDIICDLNNIKFGLGNDGEPLRAFNDKKKKKKKGVNAIGSSPVSWGYNLVQGNSLACTRPCLNSWHYKKGKGRNNTVRT